MLVSFSVSNYRSFGEEVTLNMVASNKLTDHPHHRVEIDKTGKYLVRAAVLYGANAAGKSNLVKAMAFAQRLIGWRGNQMPIAEHFRFSDSFPKKPSSFEFRFLIDERVFIYGFDVYRQAITGEWLAFMDGEEEFSVFERNEKGLTEVNKPIAEKFSNDPAMLQILVALEQIPIRPNQLFLNRITSIPESAQGTILNAVIKWLTKDLEILTLDFRSCDLLKRLDKDSYFREFSAEFLDKVDTGIRGLEFEKSERECHDWEKQFLAANGNVEDLARHFYGCEEDSYCTRHPEDSSKMFVHRLLAKHSNESKHFALPFSQESDGTQQLLHLLPIVSTRKDESKVIVIDELDRSLHPLLCWEFIRFFSDSCPGARKQLIVTTHESHLLDQDLLRRDEYWFVEKDKDQQSRLSSLSDYKVRNDLQIQKGYLQGRFGAIPVFGGLAALECLLDCSVKEGANATEKAPA